MNETVLVMDFGGQYKQLIARRVRECGVYCEVVSYKTPLSDIRKKAPKGIIFTGGPASVNAPDAPLCSREIFKLGVPVLGICYGMQLMCHVLGGHVGRGTVKEYGPTAVRLSADAEIFHGIEADTTAWMSHFDRVQTLPVGFFGCAETKDCPYAAMACPDRKLYAVQFHPEVMHTPKGTEIIRNFLYRVCGASGDWKMSSFVERSVRELREKIGDKKVLCALSGGVDSSVAAVMLHKAVGKQLTCIFVDHGLLRKNEGDEVMRVYREMFDMQVIRVDAADHFLARLRGVEEPEKKRAIIGEEFIRVFEKEAKKLGKIDFLAQGTIYPDVIESGTDAAAVIKSHHNVGGLPAHVDFREIVEPLRDLFKDEVRAAGLQMGIPPALIWRQPFPGPGLAVRVIGEVTREKLAILQDADAIFREEIQNAGLMQKVHQYFAVLTSMRSVGVMGDARTYDYTLALRAVETDDFMTAEWARLPYALLAKTSNRIINEVKGINRIVYDITTKPPATIEWE